MLLHGVARHMLLGWSASLTAEAAMRSFAKLILVGSVATALVGCDRVTGPSIEAPATLTYRLEPSGDPEAAAGLVLAWDAVLNPELEVYRVYSRANLAPGFDPGAAPPPPPL